jgi:uncharacterized coiled-coil protein SlyX
MLTKVTNRAADAGPIGGVGDLWIAFEKLTLRVLADAKVNAQALSERDERLVALEEVIAHQAITIDTLNEQLARADAAVARVDELEAKLTAADARFTELQTSAAAVAVETGRLIAEVDERLDQVRDRVDAVQVDAVEVDKAVAGAVERLAAVETAIGDVSSSAAAATLEQTKAIAGVVELIEQQRDHRQAVEQDLGEQLAGVSARLEDVAAVVPLATETANGFRDLVARVDQHGQLHLAIEEQLNAGADAVNQVEQYIGQVETATLEGIAALREEIATAAGATVDQVNQIRNETKRITSSLPKNLMIDHAGDLIAVTGEGELVPVGRVRGEDGADGATVQDVQLVEGALNVVMTDGRKLYAGKIPVAPPAVMTEAALQERACALHAAGNPYTKIAAELGVDRRKVSRWVRGKIK